jgi:hypothetical protein
MAASDASTGRKFASPVDDGRGPYVNAVSVSPNDTNDLANTTLAVWIGTAGNLSVNMEGSGGPIVFVGIPAGTLLPIRATRILSTNTTAGNILALW